MRILLAALACAAALSAGAAAWAALPPAYQRAAEFKAIAESATVAGAFDGAPIEKIEFLEEDLYRVTAGRCHLDVAIVSKPLDEGLVGPRQFEIRPGHVVCAQD